MKQKHRLDKNEILNQVKIAVMGYPMKAMADELDKAYSTLSNELDHRDTAKLGFLTTLGILEASQRPDASDQSRYAAIKALDLIEEGFNRVTFKLPEAKPNDPATLLKYASKISKEFSETAQEFGACLDPDSPGGENIVKKEALRGIKELGDLIKVCIEAQAYLQQFVTK